MANPTVNAATLLTAIRDGKAAAAAYVAAHPEGPNWYPCGFANLHYKCRKNASIASILIAEGFRWDDYLKSYSHGAYDWTNTQSLDYKSGILQAFADAAEKHGVNLRLETRWD